MSYVRELHAGAHRDAKQPGADRPHEARVRRAPRTPAKFVVIGFPPVPFCGRMYPSGGKLHQGSACLGWPERASRTNRGLRERPKVRADNTPKPRVSSVSTAGEPGRPKGTRLWFDSGMSAEPENDVQAESGSNPRLALLLAAAMFVLVVDTSFMNVSISAVVRDLHTTASGVQSAIALEALVSAAFILINSKMGDLMGRKRAYVIGLLAYAVGALAMTLTQNLTTVIIFWAIIGGLGASLLLPAMQSLIHGNFTGAAQKKAYALVGASAAIAAAVGPLLGGFVTTYLSWRVGFGLEVVIILVVLSQIRLVKDVPVHRTAQDRPRGCGSLGRRHGGRRPRHPGLAGGRWLRGPHHCHRRRCLGRVRLLARPAQAPREAHAFGPRPVQAPELPHRHLPADAPADHSRRCHDRPAALLADDAGVQRHASRALPRTAVALHVRDGAPRRPQSGQASPSQHRAGRVSP